MGRLSHGNDSDGFCIFCMHDDHNDVAEQTQGDTELFALFFAVIQDCDGVALKNVRYIAKVKAVLSKISLTFALVP